jgi:hypothetical protein
MAGNTTYTPTGNPPSILRGLSSAIRAEFALIANALANSPTLADLLTWLADHNAGGFSLKNLKATVSSDPATNAATKGYVDTMAFGQALPATSNTYSVPVIRSGTIAWELPPKFYENERALRYFRRQAAGLQ